MPGAEEKKDAPAATSAAAEEKKDEDKEKKDEDFQALDTDDIALITSYVRQPIFPPPLGARRGRRAAPRAAFGAVAARQPRLHVH